MRLRFVAVLLLYSISNANAHSFINCNTIKLSEAYSLDANGKYCINNKKGGFTIVNLATSNIELEDFSHNLNILYPGEYLSTNANFMITNSNKVVASVEHDDLVIIRDLRPNQRSKRVAPAAVWVGGGAVMGVMGVIASNPDASMRDIAAGAFGGAVTGGLSPVMGAGAIGMMASGSLGLSAGGGCTSCHQ
ncbi:MAG: hypothetical protein ACRCR1_05665 [Aeromonas sp.]